MYRFEIIQLKQPFKHGRLGNQAGTDDCRFMCNWCALRTKTGHTQICATLRRKNQMATLQAAISRVILVSGNRWPSDQYENINIHLTYLLSL